jgi:thiol-disulfide isomerase/thioredoxin
VSVSRRLKRSLPALVAAAVALPVAVTAVAESTASAAAVRTATTTSYNTATYLHDELGFPTTDTSPVVQPVTYDELQWILQQSGNSAILIGDPGEDANFKAEAQAVEAQALTDGVKEIYWFDPNLSGGTGTTAGTTLTPAQGSAISEPNLDIRNPLGINSLSTSSQVTYGNVWLNLVGQYLGDGVTATPANQDTESATVTATTGTATVNDYGVNTGYSTKIVDGTTNTGGGALYDYPTATTSGTPFTTTATSTDSYFFVYNAANTVSVSGTPEPEKIVSWVDLDSEYANATNTTADIGPDVNAAIAAVPGAASLAAGVNDLTDYSQFNWWESEGNLKQVDSVTSNADGENIPLLGSSDGSSANGGWRIDQITYPELVDLLKSGANNSTAVILFGGTWCPNTRPVIPFINADAQQNNVTVFNFDTVLDGGTVGGGTTSSSNPLQSRNSVSVGTNANGAAQNTPTFLYGDLVNTYLKNLDTQYTGSTDVTYYPGGVTTNPVQAINKLQVPFLIGYQAADGGGVNRQWIINNGNNSYTEYMSNWWDTNPQANELGLSQIPQDAPISVSARVASRPTCRSGRRSTRSFRASTTRRTRRRSTRTRRSIPTTGSTWTAATWRTSHISQGRPR